MAIVTGGAQGIGRAIAFSLLTAGGKVHFLDVDVAEGQKTQKAFDERFGLGKAKFVNCDVQVSRCDELEKAFREAKAELGGLNVVCNNAGIACPTAERTRWEKVLAINLGAAIHGSFLGFDLMGKKNGGNGGVIINTASLAGLQPAPHAPVYTATKAGMIGFTRSAALNSGLDKVRINCVCPDFTDTKLLTDVMQEMQQVMSQEEFKRQILENIHQIEGKDQNIGAQTSPFPPSAIGEEVLKLIQDESKNGQMLIVSKNMGNHYHKF